MHGIFTREEHDENGHTTRVFETVQDGSEEHVKACESRGMDPDTPVEIVIAERAGPLSTPARGEAYAAEQHRERSAAGVRKSKARMG